MSQLTLRCCLVVLGMVLSLPSLGASFETGWLKDEKGSFDPKSKAMVVAVANEFGTKDENGQMKWQGRYVGIELPISGVRATDIVAIDSSGGVIKHSYSDASAIGTNSTLIRLHFNRSGGFSFRLKYSE